MKVKISIKEIRRYLEIETPDTIAIPPFIRRDMREYARNILEKQLGILFMRKNNYQNWSKTELIEEIKRLKKRKKYGLVWEDKPEDVVEMCKNELPVVKEIKSKEIINDRNKQVNLLVEGDNYHALSVLNYTHNKAIDVI